MTPQAYLTLIECFIADKLSAEAFETKYLQALKSEPVGLQPAVFNILDRLFSDIDAYSPDCPPGQETAFCISETQLRQQAIATAAQLKSLIENLR